MVNLITPDMQNLGMMPGNPALVDVIPLLIVTYLQDSTLLADELRFDLVCGGDYPFHSLMISCILSLVSLVGS